MSDALARFRAVVQALDATAPVGAFYVQEARKEYREALLRQLELRPAAKLLVAGQKGGGKSTLLQKLAEELRERLHRLVVFQDLVSLVPIEDPTSLEVNLAALAGLFEEAGQRTTMPAEALEACRSWLQEVAWPGRGDDAAGLAQRLK